MNDAIGVVEKLKQKIDRRDYLGAIDCFAESTQQSIRQVGGEGTPIEGFMKALRPMLCHRTNVTISRGVVWLTHEHPDSEKLMVVLTRQPDRAWLITRLRGEDWSAATDRSIMVLDCFRTADKTSDGSGVYCPQNVFALPGHLMDGPFDVMSADRVCPVLYASQFNRSLVEIVASADALDELQIDA